MAGRKKSTNGTTAVTEQGTVVKRTKKISVNLHLPGEVPETLKVPQGTTLQDILNDRNLQGYEISVNRNPAQGSVVLTEGDVVRAGVKTKNN